MTRKCKWSSRFYLIVSKRVCQWMISRDYQFLVDSGTDISVLQRREFIPDNIEARRTLLVANNGLIDVAGDKTLSFSMSGIEKRFTWRFTVADVNWPIMGSDIPQPTSRRLQRQLINSSKPLGSYQQHLSQNCNRNNLDTHLLKSPVTRGFHPYRRKEWV